VEGSVDAAVAASDGDTAKAIDQAIGDVQGVDEELANLVISWDEWEVLYRVRLQVERDLAAHDLVQAANGNGEGAALSAADDASHPERNGHDRAADAWWRAFTTYSSALLRDDLRVIRRASGGVVRYEVREHPGSFSVII
jgi:hypothetical protein